MKKVNLDSILEQALEQALASLTAKAAAMVEQTLEQALVARIQALLGEAPATPEAPAVVRARAKAAVEATPEAAATPTPEVTAAAPKARRRKAKAEAAVEPPALDFGAIEAALAKYAGAHTPKGKPLNEVLARRMRKVLAHAEALGHKDLPGLARRALALIAADPMGTAMGSWKALAERLGLPVPIQGQG